MWGMSCLCLHSYEAYVGGGLGVGRARGGQPVLEKRQIFSIPQKNAICSKEKKTQFHRLTANPFRVFISAESREKNLF